MLKKTMILAVSGMIFTGTVARADYPKRTESGAVFTRIEWASYSLSEFKPEFAFMDQYKDPGMWRDPSNGFWSDVEINSDDRKPEEKTWREASGSCPPFSKLPGAQDFMNLRSWMGGGYSSSFDVVDTNYRPQIFINPNAPEDLWTSDCRSVGVTGEWRCAFFRGATGKILWTSINSKGSFLCRTINDPFNGAVRVPDQPQEALAESALGGSAPVQAPVHRAQAGGHGGTRGQSSSFGSFITPSRAVGAAPIAPRPTLEGPHRFHVPAHKTKPGRDYPAREMDARDLEMSAWATTQMTQEDAERYCRTMRNGFRLPEIYELRFARDANVPGMRDNARFWSDTLSVNDQFSAFSLDGNTGDIKLADSMTNMLVVCVRPAPALVAVRAAAAPVRAPAPAAAPVAARVAAGGGAPRAGHGEPSETRSSFLDSFDLFASGAAAPQKSSAPAVSARAAHPAPLLGLDAATTRMLDRALERMTIQPSSGGIIPVSEGDGRISSAFAKRRGNMFQLGRVIWSGAGVRLHNHVDAVRACDQLGRGSRLPTIQEYDALARAMGRGTFAGYNKAIIFDNEAGADGFWSSTPHDRYPDRVYLFDSVTGEIRHDLRSAIKGFRCVIDG